jgi:flavin-dependent dehydrogenase
MKRLFVWAMAAMFAVACGEKQLTVEEQMAQYQDRINASLEALDKMEFMQERDVMKWFGGLNETDQNLAMKMCADIEATRKEMIEWQKTLTEEDKLKLREFGKTLVTGEEHFRKMMQVNQINKMVNRRPIPKKVK